MDRKEEALRLRSLGYNCAQAVICAYGDRLDIDERQLKRITAAFGGGMGCTRGDCGALIGAQILTGLFRYEGKPIGKDSSFIYREFFSLCGASRCADLKGIDTGKVLCSCPDCIRNAVEAVERLLKEREDDNN